MHSPAALLSLARCGTRCSPRPALREKDRPRQAMQVDRRPPGAVL